MRSRYLFGFAFAVLVMQPAGETLATTQTSRPTRECDGQLNSVLSSLIASAEIGPNGEVFLSHPLGEPRLLEPNSGLYWQISGHRQADFASRSLGNRRLKVSGRKAYTGPLFYNSDQFPSEPLRVAERTVRLPGSDVEWQFVVAQSRHELN